MTNYTDYTLTRRKFLVQTPEQAAPVIDDPSSRLIICEELSVQDELVFIDEPEHVPTQNEIRVQAKLQALAALAVAGAATHGDVKVLRQVSTSRQHSHDTNISAFGVCVGRDSGRDPHAEQPRNQPCKCGSGKKAKKCCRTVGKVQSSGN